MTIAFPILPNEIEGFVQFLEEKAVLIGKRTFKVSHDKITRYLIGDNKESKNDFFSLIRPHIIPSMLYKVDYKEYKKKIGE